MGLLFLKIDRRLSAVVAAVLVSGLVAGCSSMSLPGRRPPPVAAYTERPVELLYLTGMSALDAGYFQDSTLYFEEVERQHPYSEWARRSILMAAYAHYRAGQYPESVADTERFVALFPGNSAAPYAYYLRGLNYFDQIVDVGRDQATTQQAEAAFRDLISRYPRTDYAADARLKMDMVADQLAGKELAIGRYYLREGSTLAAIGRFKTVIERYQTTSHAPEALYRLVEAYLILGVTEEAKRNAAVLGYNYPGDRWYADAYALMVNKGIQPEQRPGRQRIQRIGRFLPQFGRRAPPVAETIVPQPEAPIAAPPRVP